MKELFLKREEILQSSIPYYRYQPLIDPHHKFYDISNDRLNSFNKDKIWVSDPSTFNDTNDFKIAIKDLTHRGIEFPDLIKTFKNSAREFYSRGNLYPSWFNKTLFTSIEDWISNEDDFEQLNAPFVTRLNDFGVVCLTPEWNSSLMWAHYANNHQGFSIEYAIDKMRLAGNHNILEFDVSYTNMLPEICYSELLFSPHQTISRLLATKAVEWAYEREFRLVHLEQKSQFTLLPDGMKVTALIAGEKISQSNLENLQKIGRENNIACFKIGRKSSSYELDLKNMVRKPSAF